MEKLKAYQLTESQEHGAAIIFGRFNPPHFGHSNAWTVASKFPIWYVGTNQDTQDAKNPLPYEIKVEAMKTIMPGIEGHLVAEQSWWTLATMVYKKHGGDMVLHIVTDPTDKDIFVPSLKKANGVEGVHGFYQFQDVVWAPASRDSTATALRSAVEHDNPTAFSKAAGIDANTMIAGQPFFELVKHYMAPYLHAAAEKDRAKAEKAQQKAEKERLKAEKQRLKAEKLAMKQPKTKGPAQELAESQGVVEACWKNYKQIGMKKKGKRTVPNCVPKEGRVRIGQVLEEIYEARARGTIPTVDKDAIPNLTRYDQLDNSDSYASYRFGVALAPSPDFTNMDRKSAIANSFAMVDYTEADAKIRRGAEKTMGVKASGGTGKGSTETNDVNKISPIAKLKRNKYGI